MPSGKFTLLEASKYGSDMRKKGVVEIIISESPILEMLPQMPISGNALQHSEEETLPTVAFRDVNEDYTRSYGTDKNHFWGTAILGGEVFVDNYIVDVRGNVVDAKSRQYSKIARAAALTFDKYAIDGTGTAKDFKGVNTLVDEGFGQKLAAGANGAALTLDLLDESYDLLRKGMPDATWLNRTVRRKITKLARDVNGFTLLDVGNDALGRQVTKYNDVPLRIIGDDQNGAQILAYDETQGASSVTTSLYHVKLGEDYLTGLMGLNGKFTVKDFGEIEASPGHLGRIEFYPGIAIFDKFAVVRLHGITNA